MNNSIYIIGYYQKNSLIQFVTIVSRGGGHFAEMPNVADRRGVGVKNGGNLPTS